MCDCLCHGNCGNLWILGIYQKKVEEYEISVERNRDVELVKNELEQQINARLMNRDGWGWWDIL
ncbi:hypothetical protein [Mediterraneibacter gnavus]|uniref:hypothetical protein n=1 Tax=Mediterraneibacter gnavus TaxID=33038 RepID=UPI0011865AD0